MTTPKRRKLTKIRLDEISVVDRPAEKHSMVSVWKREEETGTVTDIEKVLKQVEEATGKLTTMEKALAAAEERAVAAEKRADEAEAKTLAVSKAVTPATGGADEGDELLKSITDPAVAAAFAKMRQQNKAATEALAKMDENAAIAKSVAICEAEFPNLSLKADEFGKVLYRAAGKLEAEDYAEVTRVLKAANGIAEMALSGRIGFAGAKPTDAETALTKAAEEIQKADGVPFSKAYQTACERHPDLYTKYRSEKFPHTN